MCNLLMKKDKRRRTKRTTPATHTDFDRASDHPSSCVNSHTHTRQTLAISTTQIGNVVDGAFKPWARTFREKLNETQRKKDKKTPKKKRKATHTSTTLPTPCPFARHPCSWQHNSRQLGYLQASKGRSAAHRLGHVVRVQG